MTEDACSEPESLVAILSDDHVELDFLGKDSMPYHQVIGAVAYPIMSRVCLQSNPWHPLQT